MCLAFRQSRHDITLIVPKYGISNTEKEIFNYYGIKNCFPIKFLPKLPVQMKGIDIGSHIFLLSAILFALRNKFEICYTRIPFCAFIARQMGMESILEMHMPPDARADLFAFQRMVIQNDRCKMVAISHSLAEILYEQFGMLLSRILVCHDAVQLEHYRERDQQPIDMKKRLGLSQERLLVTYSGSLYEGRGVEIIVELAENFPECCFLVVGGDETRISKCRQKFSYVNNLHFYGHVPHKDVAGILLESNILLMPYERRVAVDGKGDTAEYCSPMKMFEYLAAGKAVIASRLPSVCEVLKDRENALLAEPDNSRSWIKALRQLIDDEDLRTRLGAHALETARIHTWDERVTRIMSHYGYS
jgi:glycosyltransferase involved in cell wall biosynthesis